MTPLAQAMLGDQAQQQIPLASLIGASGASSRGARQSALDAILQMEAAKRGNDAGQFVPNITQLPVLPSTPNTGLGFMPLRGVAPGTGTLEQRNMLEQLLGSQFGSGRT